MNVEIYHNPSCSMSRNTLRLIRWAGVEPHIIEYLHTPPSRSALRQLLENARISVREIVRSKEPEFADLGLADTALSDDQLLDAIEAHPILLQRPIVVSPRGTRLCRPPEFVLDLLQNLPDGVALKREDGSDFLIDERLEWTPNIAAALAAEGQEVDTLDPSCIIYRVGTLDGAPVGFAGFHLQGTAAQLRTFVISADARGKGAGKHLMLLLLRRAYDLGARTMNVKTKGADEFFRKLGFEAADSVTRELVRRISLQVS